MKRGPTGVIATTMNDSFDTGILDLSVKKPGGSEITALLRERGIININTNTHYGCSHIEFLGR